MLSNFHVRWPTDKFRALHRSITSEILRIVPFVHPHYIIFFWVHFGIIFVAIKHSTNRFRSHFQNSFVSSGSPVQLFQLLGNASALPQAKCPHWPALRGPVDPGAHGAPGMNWKRRKRLLFKSNETHAESRRKRVPSEIFFV